MTAINTPMCIYCLQHHAPAFACREYTKFQASKKYEPRVGDRVALEGEVVSVYATDKTRFDLLLDFKIPLRVIAIPLEDASKLKLLSRKTRKLTKEEAQEILTKHLNEDITIE